ncbi:uncharacterized protein LOC110672327 [Hevea brasiliensis]|uniref:uncharacterized protein LOC110672327 n=1 Tax=Hevea brasiliensis TaxID=3981 RepID=UPI000B791F23|nr:uncharacterized protein LOC110672327 [Hevea brasiliensis]
MKIKDYVLKPVAGDTFEVCIRDDRFVVDLVAKTCSCKIWDLTSIPYHHACACINYIRQDNVNFVGAFYSKDNYIVTYKKALRTLNGHKIWPKVEGWAILTPPFKKMPRRPKKSRRKYMTEVKDKKNGNKS